MHLTFRRCNQCLLESRRFSPQRSLLLLVFFFLVQFLKILFGPRTLARPLSASLPLVPIVFPHHWCLCLKNGGLILFHHYLGSLMAPSKWVLYNGKSCKTANRRSDTVLVVFSKLGLDHNGIYMIMKSEELWCSCLGYILWRAHDNSSAFTLTLTLKAATLLIYIHTYICVCVCLCVCVCVCVFVCIYIYIFNFYF